MPDSENTPHLLIPDEDISDVPMRPAGRPERQEMCGAGHESHGDALLRGLQSVTEFFSGLRSDGIATDPDLLTFLLVAGKPGDLERLRKFIEIRGMRIHALLSSVCAVVTISRGAFDRLEASVVRYRDSGIRKAFRHVVGFAPFTAEDKMKARFEASTNENRRLLIKVNLRQALAHPVSEFLGTILIVLVLWYGGTLIFSHKSTIDAPTFIFYMVILYSLIQPLKDFSKAAYNIPKGMASVERVNKILKAENPIKDPVHPLPIHPLRDKIEFRHITFRYSEDGKNVLKDINLTVPRGKTIAIVGQSGSGKSTLVDLLPRYHDVQQGEILFDGTNIKNFRISDLRSLIGNVNQDAILFNDTFFNNIAFGVKEATMEQVQQAARIANAHDFIMASEQGYDTMVGDRGCRLSGGQRQRISIARAILKNPEILILDEATSALDTESERLVQDALEKLMKARTTIAIAHRLSTIKNADEIVVLHEGHIVERGTHEQLLAIQGYYRKLNDMQQL